MTATTPNHESTDVKVARLEERVSKVGDDVQEVHQDMREVRHEIKAMSENVTGLRLEIAKRPAPAATGTNGGNGRYDQLLKRVAYAGIILVVLAMTGTVTLHLDKFSKLLDTIERAEKVVSPLSQQEGQASQSMAIR